MPEWPDLHVLRGRLERTLVGRRIEDVRVYDPLVLRAERPAQDILRGRTCRTVAHRGKFLLFALDGEIAIVVNPMLSGLFELAEPSKKPARDSCLGLVLDGGSELRYRDDTRMGKVYLLEGRPPEGTVPGFSGMGPEAGAFPWSAAEFAARARKRRSEARNLLMDQTFVAGIGNAYADEILWEARLHPKRRVSSLTDDELARLDAALRSVLAVGVVAVEAGMPPELGRKVRDHLRVRGREGQPCPRCGNVIHLRRMGEGEANLCPSCQRAPKGQLF